MTRRVKVPFSSSRKRIRASFNKYNVYNALTWRKNRPSGTQYREVFAAKQESRAYHGDRLTENQFKNHFRGESPTVSPSQSSAKSSDRSADNGEADIPYGLQTFVGLERRSEFAVFRAMFASSVRQAAKFILLGSVKVNGVQIRSPGYISKAGDVFSVNPRRVLYAWGRHRPSIAESVKRTNAIIARFNKYIDRCHKNPERMFKSRQKHRRRHFVYAEKHKTKASQRSERVNSELQAESNAKVKAVKPQSVSEAIFLGTFQARKPAVMGTVKEIRRSAGLSEMPNATNVETAAKTPSKDEAKAGSSEVKADSNKDTADSSEAKADSKEVKADSNKDTAESSEVKADSNVKTDSNIKAESVKPTADTSESGSPSAQKAAAYFDSKAEAPPHRGDIKKFVSTIVDAERDALTAEYQQRFVKPGEEKYDPSWVQRLPAKLEPVSENISFKELESVKLTSPFSTTGGKSYGLAEPKKNYFTPWTPRPFSAPFAISPFHIEIDFETCHAVYMRDPVARPGHSEIISPFSLDMHERAYSWYNFRRRKNLPKSHIN